MTSSDVVVIGAGPTGLALACEVALAGARCRLLERRSSAFPGPAPAPPQPRDVLRQAA